MDPKLKRANELLNELGAKMAAITAKAVDEDRGTTADEDTEWRNIESEYTRVERLVEQIEGEAERLFEERGGEITVPNLTGAGDEDDENRSRDEGALTKRHNRVFEGYLRQRHGMMSSQDDLAFMDQRSREYRGQTVGTTTEGGFLVAEDFSNRLEVALLAHGGLRGGGAEVIKTTTGADLPWPTLDDTGNEGAIIAEEAADSDVDLVFANVTLQSYTYTSRMVKMSWELLQDDNIGIVGMLAGWLGTRLGRITNRHYILGTGTGQPRGLFTAAVTGVTTVSALPASVTHDKLLDLEHSIDLAYRGAAKYIMHDLSLKLIRQLKDGEGRPLWQPQVADIVPATVSGYGYVLDNACPQIADASPDGGEDIIGFGDLSKYKIRDVRGFSLVTLVERYAEKRQNAYFAFMRTDGDLIDAGGAAFRVMTMGT
jgi:HK97 family phage major capsid protein